MYHLRTLKKSKTNKAGSQLRSNMLKKIRQRIIQALWEIYRKNSHDTQRLEIALKQKNLHQYKLDHFAIIDLPGPNSGISYMHEIFSLIGYVTRGNDYLADKQNDFLWMAEEDCSDLAATDVLPQVVIADFRLEIMPKKIATIIERYSNQTSPPPIDTINALIKHIVAGDENAIIFCTQLILNYFAGRDWALPTVRDFHAVREFNELLAWVLIFGRRPNHFTLSIHLLDHFADLNTFNRFIEKEVKLPLNQEGGELKGGISAGIAQSSTLGQLQSIQLADGNIEIPLGFIEFVWRYPHRENLNTPKLWGDYFTGFIPQHANRVIESLYQ